MIIYKITNLKNNKVYIGQTINSLDARWKRHQNDALNNVIDTHFARAIRYYGPDSFKAEIIDTATSQEELTQKEQEWIIKYNSIQNGYNETDAKQKSGGNTYQSKTTAELNLIKEKIRQTKLGGKNPNAKKIKCKNIQTNEEYYFDSMSECQNFFQETNHQFISRRCRHEIKGLYKDLWVFAYADENYIIPNKNTKKITNKGVTVKVINNDTKEEKIFNSYTDLGKYLQVDRRRISNYIKTGKDFNQYSFKIIE